MKFLIDTNICIFLIRKQFESIHSHIRRHRVGEISVSAITEAELRFGADASAQSTKNHAVLERFFQPFPSWLLIPGAPGNTAESEPF